MALSLSDLEDAYHWRSTDSGGDFTAWVGVDDGQIHFCNPELDEAVPPEDIGDPERYLEVPDRWDLDLGTHLVRRFISDTAPEHCNEVSEIFSRKGAYRRFRSLLIRENLLELWYEYERQQTLDALRRWCGENGLELQSLPVSED